MNSQIGLQPSEEQQALASSVARFCTARDVDTAARNAQGEFPGALWRGLAGMGVFAPTSPGYEDSGGAGEVCAICETLGEYAFPGPVAATYTAMQVLPQLQREEVLAGEALVCLANDSETLLPYGTVADIFVIASGTALQLGAIATPPSPVDTLGGGQWGRAELKSVKPLDRCTRGFVLGDIARSAYLSGIAGRLLRETSAHAATRKQFGKSLGEFQAVAHPLADCAIETTAAQTLARAAAIAFDSGQIEEATRLAAGATNGARRSALHCAYTCHQIYGGIGMTLEGPAFHLTRRIRQVASEPPSSQRETALLLADAGLGS